jgi:lipopolysaccharide export system permease protein
VILQRYIGAQLLRGWLVVFVVLASLFGLLALIDEIDSITERYRFVHALHYVLLTTPQRVLELSPVIAALGTILAFATMTRNSELVVIRTAGFSLRQLLAACAVPTVALVVLLAASEEFLAASLYQQAETERMVRRSGNLDLLDGQGLWSKSGSRFFNVRNLRRGHIPEQISLYEFDSEGALLRAIDARTAELVGDREWKLIDVRFKEWHDGKLSTRNIPELEFGPFWSASELPALGQSLAAMAPSALYDYANHLAETGQDDDKVRMAFWQKATLPLAFAAMVLLSTVIGVAFGTTRSAAFGWRVLAGAVIGVGFFLLSQIFQTGAQMIGLGQAVAVLLPIALAVIVATGLAALTRGPR